MATRIKAERQYLMAVSIMNGIITLIEDDGTIQCYRQRGITRLSKAAIEQEVRGGRLVSSWMKYRELPANFSIYFVDPEIMGRALATYPLVLKANRDAARAKRVRH